MESKQESKQVTLETDPDKRENAQRKHNLFLQALREGNIEKAIDNRPINRERAYTKDKLYENSNEKSQPPLCQTMDFTVFASTELSPKIIKDKFKLCQSITYRLFNKHDRSSISLFKEWQKPIYSNKLVQLQEIINLFDEEDPRRNLLQVMYDFINENITNAKSLIEASYNIFYKTNYETKEDNQLFALTWDGSNFDQKFSGLTCTNKKKHIREDPNEEILSSSSRNYLDEIEKSKKKIKSKETGIKPYLAFHELWIQTLLDGSHNPGLDLCSLDLCFQSSNPASFFVSQSLPLDWGNLYIKKVSHFQSQPSLHYSTLMVDTLGHMVKASGIIEQPQLSAWSGWNIESFNVRTLVPFLPGIIEILKLNHGISSNLRCTLHLWTKNDNLPIGEGKLYIKISPPILEYRYTNFMKELCSGYLSMEELGCNSLTPDTILTELEPYFAVICKAIWKNDSKFRPNFSPFCRDQLYKFPAQIIANSGPNVGQITYRPLEAAIFGACKTGNLNQLTDILNKMSRHHPKSCLSLYFEFRYLHLPYSFATKEKDTYGDLLKILAQKCSDSERDENWKYVEPVYNYISPIIMDAKTKDLTTFNQKYCLTLNNEEVDELVNLKDTKEQALSNFKPENT